MEPAISAYFLSDFPLVPPLKNFKKWPILVSLRNWPLLGIAGTFRAAVCGRMLSDDCTLSAYQLIEDGISDGVVLEPANSAYFLCDFPLVPPLKNFKKWPILVSLQNWPLLGIAGPFRAAVCGRMLSDDCTLSAYQLNEDGICAGVVLKHASSAYFLSDFPLVPPLKNFKKWPILVSLQNWPLLGIAGTFRAAVCGRMLSDYCTLRAYQLIENGISAG